MDEKTIFPAGSTQGCRYAVDYLQQLGLPVRASPESHIRYLLLDVPSFEGNGQLRGGGNIEKLLQRLPPDITVCGGNLNHPALANYNCVDFLMDEIYLCQNAYITAECALDVALPYLTRTIRACPVLILGWGRIGKCLGKLLWALGADVTVAVRNSSQHAMLRALGYQAADIPQLTDTLGRYRLIYNTVPHPILSKEQLALCREDCVKIELASKDGMAGDNIIIARGLPGLHMPESSGELIAKTFLRLCYGR